MRDGWLHTGDMGYICDSEHLYVVGRFKPLLIFSDGKNLLNEKNIESL